jgi:hypothetical protein
MIKSVFRILTAAVVMGIALYPAAGSAAPLRPAALAYSSSSTPSGGDPSADTTVTFSVTVGALSITAPGTANLGTGLPGGKIDGALGTVTVTDNRALLAASWTATANSTDWTTGGGTGNETIPAGDVVYDPGTVNKTGTITVNPSTITLSSTAQTVVAATAGVGNNTAAWDPNLEVSVPAAAVGGAYSGTVTDSVS